MSLSNKVTRALSRDRVFLRLIVVILILATGLVISSSNNITDNRRPIKTARCDAVINKRRSTALIPRHPTAERPIVKVLPSDLLYRYYRLLRLLKHTSRSLPRRFISAAESVIHHSSVLRRTVRRRAAVSVFLTPYIIISRLHQNVQLTRNVY